MTRQAVNPSSVKYLGTSTCISNISTKYNISSAASARLSQLRVAKANSRTENNNTLPTSEP